MRRVLPGAGVCRGNLCRVCRVCRGEICAGCAGVHGLFSKSLCRCARSFQKLFCQGMCTPKTFSNRSAPCTDLRKFFKSPCTGAQKVFQIALHTCTGVLKITLHTVHKGSKIALHTATVFEFGTGSHLGEVTGLPSLPSYLCKAEPRLQ